jgi:hypothetical protein
MAPSYNIISDFGGPDGLASYAPQWVIAVVRFKNQNTFDLAKGTSVSNDTAFAMAEREPLIITNATSVQVSSTKDAHVTSLTATLVGDRNYLTAIMPGDWVFCNMVHSDDEAQRIVEAFRAKKPVNGWLDGLKFVGRAQSPRKSVVVNPGDGSRLTSYTLNAAGFGEFDQQLFYHPALRQDRKLPASMLAFGLLLEDIVKGQAGSDIEGGSIDINKVLPQLLTAVFGRGVWSGDRGPNGERASPNQAYLVPATVGAWLGINARTYSDLLRPLLGIQHYQTTAAATNDTVANQWSLFQPDHVTVKDGVIRTNSALVGLFLPAPPQYETTVWNLLETYRNHPINEMFVTLRSTPDGQVLPHLIVRQTPYTTDAKAVSEVLQRDANQEAATTFDPLEVDFTKKQPDNLITATPRADVTDFLEIPRWVLDGRLLQTEDTGRSDSMRFNYVHLTGAGRSGGSDIIGSFVRAPPNSDDLDIARNGLRPYMTSLSSYWRGSDIFNGPLAWRDIMTDIVMGQHLLLSGTIATYGILPPISVGDNLEFENVVYHIEQITHMCQISPNGMRSWQTILSVSHGVLTETARESEQGRNGAFAGTNEEQELATYLPVTEEKNDGT